MNTLSVVLLGLICITAITAQTPCSSRITAVARASSGWTDGISNYQIYDITVNNDGSCPLLRVAGFFGSATGRITEGWNYDYTSGLITGYGSALQVGQTFTNAGFVLANSSAPTLAFNRPGCDDACIASHASTAAPTSTPTSTPTSKPTSTPTSTSAPTTGSPCGNGYCESNQLCATMEQGPACYYRLCSDLVCDGPNQICINDGGIARCVVTGGHSTVTPPPAASTATPTTATPTTPAPTTSASTTPAPTTPAPGTCAITATVVRDPSSWTDAQGRNNAIHRLMVTNHGPCALALYVTSFAFSSATLVSSWNLTPTVGGYRVQGYGASLAAGATYSGAGFILADAPDTVVATTYGTSCRCM